MFKNELYHYGVLGMKWGVHKKRTSTNSVGVSKSAKRYKKGEYKEAKRKAKENKARRIKKAYNSFLKDLDVLQKKGMGNDIDAVIKRSKIYDSQLSSIKDQYKEEMSKAKQLLNQSSQFLSTMDSELNKESLEQSSCIQ